MGARSAVTEVSGHPACLLSMPCRLATLEARVAHLLEARVRKAEQVEERRAQNAAQRAAYEELRVHVGLQEVALRRLQEEERDLLERLMQRKARAAAERNLRNERRERYGSLSRPLRGGEEAGVVQVKKGGLLTPIL